VFVGKFLLGVLALIFFALPCRAQMPVEPLDVVRSFYAPGYNENTMPLSARLTRLLDAAAANSKKHNAPVSGLDFAWTTNAQDTHPGYERSLQFGQIKREEHAALIRVAFYNGRDEELRYEMKRENGNWVVDDILYLRSRPPTTLARMLADGANEAP
jgi:hypothetical protein